MKLIDDKNFYPTPQEALELMFKDVKIGDMVVLEPSAGKGDIADYLLSKKSRYDKINIDCIEINPVLQATLKGKNYKVVHDDFLTFQTFEQYDLIVMNPPFDNGDKHLLKALELQKDGGAVICLLNAETLKNPYSQPRKILVEKLKELSATIEYHSGLFSNAERQTDVEVAIVKVLIPKEEKESEFLERMQKAFEYEEIETTPEQENKIVIADLMEMFKAMVKQYHIEVSAGIEFAKEYQRLSKLMLNELKNTNTREVNGTIIEGCDYRTPIIELKICGDRDFSINKYVKKTRYKYWKALLTNKKFIGKLTVNLRNEFYDLVNNLEDYEFSIYNILVINDEIISKTIQGIEKTILNLFDRLSQKHSYLDEQSKNVHYFNGWKTNKAHKINKKVIIPFYLFERWGSVNTCTAVSTFEDMTKVLDYLDCGQTVYDYSVEDTIRRSLNNGDLKNIDLKYFKLTFFKKGTCHITFKDEKLLEKFNLFGCQRKGWLPPNYGKKPTSEMNAEELELVKEFSASVDNYNEILINQEYYLVETQKLLA